MTQPKTPGSGRTWISCPGCAEKYVVEVDQVSSGGGMTCRICHERIPMPSRAMTGSMADMVVDGPTEHPSALRASWGIEPDQADDPDDEGDSPDLGAGIDVAGAAAGTRVTCPRCRHSFVPGGGEPSSTEPAGKKTILIVEDTEFFLSLAREVLGGRYNALCARNTAEAMAHLREQRVDLVVLDLSLESEEDGVEILDCVAAEGVPCLIFTAKSESELWGDAWERLKQKGATDLLLKGMNIEENLLSKVNLILSGT